MYDKTVMPGTSSKLTTAWKPYYRIVQQITPVNFIIKHQISGKTKAVHAERLHPAHVEGAWDKERIMHKQIGHKYHARNLRVHQEPTRDQPLQQAKLLVSEPDKRMLPVEYQNKLTPHSGVDRPQSPRPLHRYDLRTRPVRRLNDAKPGTEAVKRKRQPLDCLNDSQKRLKLESATEPEPMDISYLETMKLPDWILVLVGIFSGMIFMMVATLCIR